MLMLSEFLDLKLYWTLDTYFGLLRSAFYGDGQ